MFSQKKKRKYDVLEEDYFVLNVFSTKKENMTF